MHVLHNFWYIMKTIAYHLGLGKWAFIISFHQNEPYVETVLYSNLFAADKNKDHSLSITLIHSYLIFPSLSLRQT